MLFLGVDPAMTGAAVLLDQQRNALATFFWTPRQRGGSKVWEMVFALRLDGDHRFDPRAAPWVSRATVSPFGSLGERIREIIREASGGGYLLAGENAIVGRGRSTSIIVARNSGRILGPLEALAAGQEAEPWFELGARIGEAFQVADDLRDALYDEATLGKPAGQDDLHGRPNAVAQLGVDGAIRRLKDILGGAIASIPSCPGEAQLAQMVRAYADRLTPVAPARQSH